MFRSFLRSTAPIALLLVLGLFSLLMPLDPSGTMSQYMTAVWDWVAANPSIALYALAGFFLGSASHIITDSVYSGFKRLFRA